MSSEASVKRRCQECRQLKNCYLFEEGEILSSAQKDVARKRVLYGAGWVDGAHGRLNFARYCVSGHVTGQPGGLQIAIAQVLGKG